jgi:glycosyltransferase involved in cell wall biosynthesis
VNNLTPGRYYVCNTEGKSGIAQYAIDFHNLVLGPLGYALVEPKSITRSFLTACSAASIFHIELGGTQFEERDALLRILGAGHRNVDATLHDPPFLTFPFFSFRSPLLNRLSRGVDWYLGTFGIQRRYLNQLRRVFVLSDRGAASLRQSGAKHIERIPHIIDAATIWKSAAANSHDILYFGFIGPNKGIEYALRLHSRILSAHPTVRLHVIGEASGSGTRPYLDGLRARYQHNVVYHGYVDQHQLNALFVGARHVFLPFEEYRYIHPVSGSLINSIKRGRVLWASPVNAVPEVLIHGQNGLFLSKNVDVDAALFSELVAENAKLNLIGENALATARAFAAYPYRKHF